MAIEPDNAIRDELSMIQKRLQVQGVKGNFVPRENFHLTVAFIGEYPDPYQVSDALCDITFDPVRLTLSGFGCFRDLFYVGVSEDTGLLANVKRIRRALSDNGIPFDRKRFEPHITILRNMTYEKGIPTDAPFPAAMDVTHITLMRSDRAKRGMIYTPVDEYDIDQSGHLTP